LSPSSQSAVEKRLVASSRSIGHEGMTAAYVRVVG
jgi:hypothetical protein